MPLLSLKKNFIRLYRFSNFEVRRKVSYNINNYNLKNIKKILRFLGNPQNNFLTIHVAGSKGKGTVTHYLSRFFLELGFSVGHTLSPQIVDERDRFYYNSKKITFKELNFCLEPILDVIEKEKITPTIFDIFTALAFIYFQFKKVNLAIVETGLGGRWDSTNVLNPWATVITQIDKEHTDKLGKTLKKIAFEKAGIIKKRKPIFFLWQNNNVNQVIMSEAMKKKAPCFPLKKLDTRLNDKTFLPPNDHLDEALKKNLSLSLDVIKNLGYDLLDKKIKKILKKRFFLGRYQKVNNFILDGSHTPLSMKNLVATIKEDQSLVKYKKVNFIFYALADKKIKSLLVPIPKNWNFYFFDPQFFYVPKWEVKQVRRQLQKVLKDKFNELISFDELKLNQREQELFIVTGSFKIVGWFLKEKLFKKSEYKKLFLK